MPDIRLQHVPHLFHQPRPVPGLRLVIGSHQLSLFTRRSQHEQDDPPEPGEHEQPEDEHQDITPASASLKGHGEPAIFICHGLPTSFSRVMYSWANSSFLKFLSYPPRACAFQGEARLYRTVLRPFDRFTERLVCRGAWSLWILATPPRHPFTHRLDGHTRFSARGGQGRATSQRDGDRHLHRSVQLRRPASRARVYGGVQIRQIHAWGSVDAWGYGNHLRARRLNKLNTCVHGVIMRS
jgi:hypothetical protein